MDIRVELKKSGIDTEIDLEQLQFKFTVDGKDITFSKNQLDNLFLETLVNQIKFQAKMQS